MTGTLTLESTRLYLANGTERRMIAVIAFSDLPVAQEICLRWNDCPGLADMVGQERIKNGDLLGENRRLRAFQSSVLDAVSKIG